MKLRPREARRGPGSGCMIFIVRICVEVFFGAIGPPSKSFAAQCMPFEMADQEVLADKGAITLVAREDAVLYVIELVS